MLVCEPDILYSNKFVVRSEVHTAVYNPSYVTCNIFHNLRFPLHVISNVCYKTLPTFPHRVWCCVFCSMSFIYITLILVSLNVYKLQEWLFYSPTLL
jgi:hypothetical protein